MTKRYESCGYAVEVYPGWTECGKPVKVGAGAPRCADHGERLPYWPKDEPMGTNAVLLEAIQYVADIIHGTDELRRSNRGRKLSLANSAPPSQRRRRDANVKTG